MDIFISTALLLTISCCLRTTEGRKYKSVITVPNGGPWGYWGDSQFCSRGYARGFEQKLSPDQNEGDDTALEGILFHCTNQEFITSTESRWGTWTKPQYCPKGMLKSFSLRVQPYQGTGDDTAANNIQFTCSDGSKLMGAGMDWGEFGEWSPKCPFKSAICGIQTKLEGYQWSGDDTSINDVKFFCC